MSEGRCKWERTPVIRSVPQTLGSSHCRTFRVSWQTGSAAVHTDLLAEHQR